MAKIIRERQPVVYVEYTREFTDETNSGYSFYCNANGELDMSKMSEAAIKNFQRCLNGDFPELTDRGIVRRELRTMEPAVMKCDCNTEFQLTNQYYGACSCPTCDQWYNLFGQKLNPPGLWEERMDEDY